MLKALEEVRWMAVYSKFPIIVYTDQSALRTILRGDNAQGRLAGWQARIAEYDLDIRHVPSKELTLATGLSRMPYEIMDDPINQDPG